MSIWILDKRGPTEGLTRWELVVDACRRDAAAMARLKHPAIVKVRRSLSKHAVSLPSPPGIDPKASRGDPFVSEFLCIVLVS